MPNLAIHRPNSVYFDCTSADIYIERIPQKNFQTDQEEQSNPTTQNATEVQRNKETTS